MTGVACCISRWSSTNWRAHTPTRARSSSGLRAVDDAEGGDDCGRRREVVEIHVAVGRVAGSARGLSLDAEAARHVRCGRALHAAGYLRSPAELVEDLHVVGGAQADVDAPVGDEARGKRV